MAATVDIIAHGRLDFGLGVRGSRVALIEHCAAIGRGPNEIARSMQTIVRGDDPETLSATRSLIVEDDQGGRRAGLARRALR
jgi:hypothetical protein